MPMIKDMKLEILLSSFESLKDDFIEYSSDIQSLLSQVMDIDAEIVIEMWHYLINNNQELINKDKRSYGEAYDLLGGMVHELAHKPSFATFERALLQDSKLMDTIYRKTPCSSGSMLQIISDLIRENRFDDANRALELLFNNQTALAETSFPEILFSLIEEYLLTEREYGSVVSFWRDPKIYGPEVYDFIQQWIERIPSNKERAKVNISLLKLC